MSRSPRSRSLCRPRRALEPSEPRSSGRPGLTLEDAMWRFAAGDDSAFADVYRLAAPRIYGMLIRLCREPALAEDLTQDTFLRMHRARAAYRQGAEVLPWAYTIGRRLLVDLKRHRRYESRSADPCDDSACGVALQSTFGADDEVSARRMAAAVDEAIDRLPPRQAQAFRMIRGEGLSLSEAADRLGETRMAMRLRAHRATQAIRKLLEEQWHMPPGCLGRMTRDVDEAA